MSSASNCRSCDAPIVWARTTNGKNIPVDADPSEDGTFALIEAPDDGTLLAVWHTKALEVEPDYDGLRHLSHFATCPNSEDHRTRTPERLRPFHRRRV